MKKALFAGTFDPPTLGHIDIIQRAASLCDQLCIGIACNSAKNPLFSVEERKSLLQTITKHISNVEIIPFSGLTVDFAKSIKAAALVRGLRSTSDFDFEFQMAASNRAMTGIETLLLPSAPQLSHITASLIREIASNGRRLHGFVPETIEEIIFTHIHQLKNSTHNSPG